MRVVFWNVQRSGLDEGGWLEDDLADLIHRTNTPEAIVLCELSEGYTGGGIGRMVQGWSWEVVPPSPMGTGGDYLRDTSLRLAAIQPAHGAFTQTLVGRGVGQSRPSLMLTRMGAHTERVAFVHLPAQWGGAFNPVPPATAMNEIALGLAADGHHVGPGAPYDLAAVVGDMNVNASNGPDRTAFLMQLAASDWQNFVVRRPNKKTHRSGSELDWALVAPGIVGASVDRLNWRQPKGGDDEEWRPQAGGVKNSDHWPIELTW